MSIDKFEAQETKTLKEIADLLEVSQSNTAKYAEEKLEDKSIGNDTEIQCRTSKSNEYATYLSNRRQSIEASKGLRTVLLMSFMNKKQKLKDEEPK